MKDLILFTGQSNMQGQTGVLPSPNLPAKNSLEYRLASDSLVPLVHPTGENLLPGGAIGNGNPETDVFLAAWQGCGSLIPYFCDAYAEASGAEPVAVQAAKGATTIAYWQKGGAAYDLLVKKFRAAENKVGSSAVRRRFALFLQGESDAIEGNSTAYYKEKLSRYIDDLKADLGIEQFFIIRIGRFTEDERDFAILRAQEELAFEGKALLLTRITGELLQKPEIYQSYERAHYNNLAFSVIGRIAGENCAAYYDGKPFRLEEEPYEGMKK